MSPAPPAPPATRPAARAPFTATLLAAVWIALATGTIEVIVLAFRKVVLGHVLHLSPHFVWMAPLGTVGIVAVPALTIAAAAALWPRLVTWPRATGFFAFLAALGLISLFPRLHRIAMLLLAAGVGVQASRWASARPDRLIAAMRRSLAILAGAITLAGIGVGGASLLRERRALAALPDAQAGAPNILFIILDTVRAASLSLYGYDKPTSPALDAFARRDVVFDRAISPSPWTLPSHGAMFTGHDPHEQSSDWEAPLDDAFPTLAEVLAARGWMTAGFVANVFYGTYEHGLDRGFARYEDFRISPGQVFNSSSLASLVLAGRPGFTVNPLRRLIDNLDYLGRKDADRVNADFLRWLDRRAAERPFFAFLNYIDAHWPYVAPADVRRQFGVTARWGYNVPAYDAAIAGIDRELGRLLDTLDERGVLDNTIVVIASDHGEHLGEHDRTGHGNSLYMENLHVPLVIVFPGSVPAGVRVSDFVTTRSLAATLLDLAGQADASLLPGRSLRHTWAAGSDTSHAADPVLSSARQTVRASVDLPISQGDMAALIDEGHQFIQNGDGSEELYDLRVDMAQHVDRLTREPGLADRLRAALTRLLTNPTGRP